MDNEKFNKVISYFNDLGIEVPTEVKNSIEDAFHENDNFTVECYFADELLSFEKDMTLLNSLNIDLNGSSNGFSNATWTYYGDIGISYSESSYLLKDGEKVYEINEDVNVDDYSDVSDPNDWVVIMLATTEWDTNQSNNMNQKMILRIFCPFTEDGEKLERGAYANK